MLAGDHNDEEEDEEMLRAASVLTAIADGHWTGKLAFAKFPLYQCTMKQKYVTVDLAHCPCSFHEAHCKQACIVTAVAYVK